MATKDGADTPPTERERPDDLRRLGQDIDWNDFDQVRAFLADHPRYFLEHREYRPFVVVWELTLRCNMRCEHCGSAAGKARPNELTLDEGLALCDDLAALGCRWLTLLGGEPFLSPHWKEFAERLSGHGILVNAITNGYLMDGELVHRIKETGLSNVAISIDGMAENHDALRRRENSFERADRALRLLHENGVPTAVVTTITGKNLGDLDRLHDFLVERRVERWQFQIAYPQGRLTRESPWVMQPNQLPHLVEFLLRKRRLGAIIIDAADDIGYFTEEERELRPKDWTHPYWTGCQAGCQVLGIESNGDVKGCLSLPFTPEFREGNIREEPIARIWNRPGAFAYNRAFRPEWLKGPCAECEYRLICRAGCCSMAHALSGSPFDNPYCLRRIRAAQR